jgi:hypothetical protein
MINQEEKALEKLKSIIPDYNTYMEKEFSFTDLWNDVAYEMGLYEDKIDGGSLITKKTHVQINKWLNEYEDLIEQEE